jgi:hypothetical protein
LRRSGIYGGHVEITASNIIHNINPTFFVQQEYTECPGLNDNKINIIRLQP